MNKALKQFEHHPGSSVSDQLTVFVRGLIQSGRLKVDEKLPSSQELARLWSTQAARVHTALTPLVREGLLHRVQCRGTFVRAVPRMLRTLGIYLYRDIWHDEHAFARALCRAFGTEAAERGMKTAFFVDVRPFGEQTEPWEALMQAARQGEIQAVVAPQTSARQELWYGRMPVPVAVYGKSSLATSVTSDMSQFIDKGLVELARQGCRKLSVITVAPLRDLYGYAADDARDPVVSLTSQAAALGMEVSPKHIMQPGREDVSEARARSFGYQCLQKLWRMPDHPDGVLVFTDIAARGVVAGALELHIDVPRQLRLVLHRNEGLPLECPLPASFVETSPAQAARALVDQVVRQFSGQKCHPIVLGVSVVGRPANSERTAVDEGLPGPPEAGAD